MNLTKTKLVLEIVLDTLKIVKIVIEINVMVGGFLPIFILRLRVYFHPTTILTIG